MPLLPNMQCCSAHQPPEQIGFGTAINEQQMVVWDSIDIVECRHIHRWPCSTLGVACVTHCVWSQLCICTAPILWRMQSIAQKRKPKESVDCEPAAVFNIERWAFATATKGSGGASAWLLMHMGWVSLATREYGFKHWIYTVGIVSLVREPSSRPSVLPRDSHVGLPWPSPCRSERYKQEPAWLVALELEIVFLSKLPHWAQSKFGVTGECKTLACNLVNHLSTLMKCLGILINLNDLLYRPCSSV